MKELSIDDYNKLPINLKFSKISKESNDKYWKSGTGYGHSSAVQWNINDYLSSQENKKLIIVKTLYEISKIDSNTLIESELDKLKFIIKSQISGTTIMDLNDSSDMYQNYINIIDKFNLEYDDYTFVQNLFEEIKDIINNKEFSKI
jgi:hypothetical protein